MRQRVLLLALWPAAALASGQVAAARRVRIPPVASFSRTRPAPRLTAPHAAVAPVASLRRTRPSPRLTPPHASIAPSASLSRTRPSLRLTPPHASVPPVASLCPAHASTRLRPPRASMPLVGSLRPARASARPRPTHVSPMIAAAPTHTRVRPAVAAEGRAASTRKRSRTPAPADGDAESAQARASRTSAPAGSSAESTQPQSGPPSRTRAAAGGSAESAQAPSGRPPRTRTPAGGSAGSTQAASGRKSRTSAPAGDSAESAQAPSGRPASGGGRKAPKAPTAGGRKSAASGGGRGASVSGFSPRTGGQPSAQVSSYADTARAELRELSATLSSTRADELVTELRAAMVGAADAEKAAWMHKYMRSLFTFYGLQAPERRAVQAPVVERLGWRKGGEVSWEDVASAALRLWEEEQREMQYVALDLLSSHVKLVTADEFERAAQLLRVLVQTKSWWCTVDMLASSMAGALVRAHPSQGVALMDEWAAQRQCVWLTRVAVLHQLQYKEETNMDRLLRYCEARLDDNDFFVSKAIGWALRAASRSSAHKPAVREWVGKHHQNMSRVALKEATKYL